MALEKLRYFLTEHNESIIFEYRNFYFLIHKSVDDRDLLNKINDDIKMLPELKMTPDQVNIKFYQVGYQEEIYSKDELLAFVFASISQDWNIIKGISLNNLKPHFWLENGEVVYDPSLAIITNKNIYYKKFKKIQEIEKENINSYLYENNNLYKFYKKQKGYKINRANFSINFINNVVKGFNENIKKQLTFTKDRLEEMKKYITHDDFMKLRQFLTLQRISYLQSSKIAIHPTINPSVLESIDIAAKNIYDLMLKEYNDYFNYYHGTIGNCYGLSIMLNLYDESFKLVQGGIPYQKQEFNKTKHYFYQHSWLEKDDFVYDPAFRIITPKNLYYIFVDKQDEYTSEETENILRRIGFNLTHFSDYMKGKQIGGNETVRYRRSVDDIDSDKFKEEGEKLISLVKSIKK